mmetsp:Transcript_18977/g.39124  ORF Transcript_18977/g.39124 Transcript_18977/m.39124 type:complete len:285 (+) Transcript_18977:219-1073(+)
MASVQHPDLLSTTVRASESSSEASFSACSPTDPSSSSSSSSPLSDMSSSSSSSPLLSLSSSAAAAETSSSHDLSDDSFCPPSPAFATPPPPPPPPLSDSLSFRFRFSLAVATLLARCEPCLLSSLLSRACSESGGDDDDDTEGEENPRKTPASIEKGGDDDLSLFFSPLLALRLLAAIVSRAPYEDAASPATVVPAAGDRAKGSSTVGNAEGENPSPAAPPKLAVAARKVPTPRLNVPNMLSKELSASPAAGASAVVVAFAFVDPAAAFVALLEPVRSLRSALA